MYFCVCVARIAGLGIVGLLLHLGPSASFDSFFSISRFALWLALTVLLGGFVSEHTLRMLKRWFD
jgi:hypothetical protein